MTIRSLFLASLCALGTVSAQAPPANAPGQEQLIPIVKEIRAQQVALAANQVKIEEKLAAVTEAIRLARIYASRAGR